MSDHGYRVRWRGGTYEAWPALAADRLVFRLYRPDPADGFVEVDAGRHAREVPADEVERLSYRRRVAHWAGARYLVVAEDDERGLLVEHLDGPAPGEGVAEFEDHGFGVRRAWVPAAELTGTDLVDEVLRPIQ